MQDVTPAKGGASFYCRSLRKPRECAPIFIGLGSMKEVVSFRVGAKGEADIGSGHNWIWMDIIVAIGGKEKKGGRGK